MNSISYEEKSDEIEKNRKRIFIESGIIQFPERLKLAMERAGGLSNIQLAKRADMSESVVRKYLKGDTYPTLDRVALLADACKCSVEWLVTGENDSSHEKTILAQKDAPKGLDSAGELIAVISRMSEDDRERLLSIIYTNGVASLLKLGDEQNVKLLQLPDSVKSGVLELASAPDTAIRESLSSLAENAHTASVENKKAV